MPKPRAKRRPVLALELMPCVEAESSSKRDDWLDECAQYWRQFAGGVRVPFAQLMRWRTQYGLDLPLDILAGIVDRGMRPEKPTAYLAAALRLESERRQARLQARQAVDEDAAEPDALEQMMNEEDGEG